MAARRIGLRRSPGVLLGPAAGRGSVLGGGDAGQKLGVAAGGLAHARQLVEAVAVLRRGRGRQAEELLGGGAVVAMPHAPLGRLSSGCRLLVARWLLLRGAPLPPPLIALLPAE